MVWVAVSERRAIATTSVVPVRYADTITKCKQAIVATRQILTKSLAKRADAVSLSIANELGSVVLGTHEHGLPCWSEVP